MDRLRVLHAIHDFLPRHQAGSEIYAFDLCKELGARHHVTVLSAEYDPARRHGEITWRVQDGLPIVEIVNNWVCRSFADTYRSPSIGDQLGHVLRMIQPEVIHLHNLLNLSFDLPARARALGIPVVATLHDYTLVCASGGQRLHRADRHLCDVIDPERCARCFRESPFYAQTTFAEVTAATGSALPLYRMASAVTQRLPRLSTGVGQIARSVAGLAVTERDIEERLAAARRVFADAALFVAPSRSIADEFCRLGLDAAKVRISDYGFRPLVRRAPVIGEKRSPSLRMGFVGTLAWHKGLHVLLEAVRTLPADRCELTVFGDLAVFPDYAAKLRAQAAGLPVRFAGRFDRVDTPQIYANMDVLVVPSLWLENSPLVIHEAFMCGVPVVGARIGGIADLIAHGEHGLLYDPPDSSAALASALRRLIESPHQLSEFAKNLPHVKSIADDAHQWEMIYAEAIAEHVDRPGL